MSSDFKNDPAEERERLRFRIRELERQLAEKNSEFESLKKFLHKPIDVLVVEDSPADRKILADVFRDFGAKYTVHFVVDGDEALDYLNRKADFGTAPRPNLVLLDLNLPKRDGREVLKVMKTNKELRSIPVLILTTSSDEWDFQECRTLEACGFITKPANIDAYHPIIRELPKYCGINIPAPRS